MIMDELLEFADAVALDTGAPATFNLGDIVLAQPANVQGDLGNVEMLNLVIQLTTAVTSAGAATVVFLLVSNASSTIPVDGTVASVIWQSPVIPKADLVAGYTLVVPLPKAPPDSYRRYLAVQYTVGTAALTAGAVNAFLTSAAIQNWKALPEANR